MAATYDPTMLSVTPTIDPIMLTIGSKDGQILQTNKDGGEYINGSGIRSVPPILLIAGTALSIGILYLIFRKR